MRKFNIRFVQIGIVLVIITLFIPYGIEHFLTRYKTILVIDVYIPFMYGAFFLALIIARFEKDGKIRRIDYVVLPLTVVTVLGCIQTESKTIVTFKELGAKDTDARTVFLKNQQDGIFDKTNYQVSKAYQLYLYESH